MQQTERRLSVALAVRVSSTDGGEKGTVDTQLEFLQDFARFRLFDVKEIYIDDGVSGTIPFAKRDEGGRLLRDVQKRRFDAVVFYKVDRVGRTIKVIYDFMTELDRYGVGFISATQPVDTTTPFGKAILGVLSVFAELERNMVVERMLDGRRDTAKNGGHAGGVPLLGYVVVDEEGDQFPTLAPDVTAIPGLQWSEAELVRLIFRRFVEDRLSLLRLADWLDRQGIPPVSLLNYPRHVTRGKRPEAAGWSYSTLHRIITNPIYKGEKVWGVSMARPGREEDSRSRVRRSEPAFSVPVPHLALVDEDLWQAAQDRLRANVRGRERRTNTPFMLGGGLIRCEGCGYVYTGLYRNKPSGHTWRSYVCGGRANPRRLRLQEACGAPYLPAERYEAAIWECIEEFTRKPQKALSLIQQRLEQEFGDTSAVQAKADGIASQLTNLRAARGRAERLFLRGNWSEEQLDTELAAIDREEEGLRLQMEALSGVLKNEDTLRRHLQSAEELLERLRPDVEGDPTPEQKARIVREAVDRVVVRQVKGEWRVFVEFVFGTVDNLVSVGFNSVAGHEWPKMLLNCLVVELPA